MEAIATKGCRRGPHGKFTEAELDGVHLVLCNNAEYLIHTCHWEEKYHHEFDEFELREYVNEWQDAVLRGLDKLGTVEVTPDEPAHLYRARMSERLDAAIALLEKERALGRDLDPVLQKAGYRDHQERIDALNADRESFCEPHYLPEYITDHITVEYSALGYSYWNGYRNGDNGGLHVATGVIVALPECASKSPHYSRHREPLMRAITHAACDAHDWITERIERDLRLSLGQKAAQAIGDFLQEVNA